MVRYSTDVKVQAITLLCEGLSQVAVKQHLQSMVNFADTYQKCGWPLDFTGEECKFMADLIEADPTLNLVKICDSMYNDTGVFVLFSTIADDLTECLKLTWKKVQKVHPNQSPVKQAEYIDAIAGLQPEMLVFAGESFRFVSEGL
ncbi:hypothetical protein CROQUDRAFT_656022 [Cronartium quercuum f. sp. fusiforme G11]|uniref:Uncharacterized protein n=1 Tax=Cronartium quercuum f. sp. fusiforme G11 TaxID=708437 RepID=A0A9P6TCL9_9BASI|nr:hypothetical protein CROQUDRAFT_656022 [Cronartium quercuum f. sp. fusiforme G11]